VRLFEQGNRAVTVNDKSLADYFQQDEYQRIAMEALQKAGGNASFDISVRTTGGGMHAQAEAVRHGIARALVSFDGSLRSTLKAFGFLTRDPRMRERKKFGLKRARRARQWRKR
jgi:small subunit ribosomal protein S9